MDVKFRATISLENLGGKSSLFQKNFIIYNCKIKSNIPYQILLLEVCLPSIESMAMIKYLMYKNKITYMKDKMFPIIASNSRQ
jgi:hypothetical protein